MISRPQIYTLLIILSAGIMLGRTLAVNRTDTLLLQQSRFDMVNKTYDERAEQLKGQFRESEDVSEEELGEQLAELENRRQQALDNEKRELPFFSANDRSRWTTIRALVEPDMRVLRTVTQSDGTENTETVWYAIDKVQSLRGWDTIDMVKHDLPDQPGVGLQPGGGYLYSSKPPLLPTLMAIPYAIMYWASEGKLSLANEPFLIVRVTLIACNLLPLVLGWFLLSRLIERFGTTDWGRVFCVAFLCFGTYISTFAVTLNNHLPGAVSVAVALYCAVLIVYDQKTRWRYFVLAGLSSAFAAACEMPALFFCVLIGLWLLRHRFQRTLFLFVPAVLVVAGAFFVTNYIAHKTVIPAYGKKYTEDSWYLYDYEREGRILQSYWKNPKNLDVGEACHKTYIFHTTIGHHGLFSLTPVWVLSFLGLAIWLFDRRYCYLSAMILLTSIVVFAFYMQQPLSERNYGGNASAFRWLFWLAPLWSVALVAAADQFSRNMFTRAIALACLLVSAMSAAYPTWNPWTMPWAYNLLRYIGG